MNEKIILLNSHDLRNAISKIASIVSKKSTRPILSNSLFKFSDNKLEVLSTDLDVSAKVIIPCNTQGHVGNFCLNTKNIFDILREMPNVDVQFKINQEQKVINLEAENIKYSLLIVSSQDFPEISFDSKLESNLVLNAEDLKDIIQKTSYAMSTDETRMFLNGIYMHSFEGHLRAVAIDGHRLALIDKNIPLSNDLSSGIIIPRKGISELKKMSDSLSGDSINISFSKTFLIASTENYFISIRLISREYPKYASVIPTKPKNKVEFKRDDLISAIKRIKILSNETTNGIKLLFTDNSIQLKAANEVYGQAQEQITSSYDGEEVQMSLNAGYLLDTLNVMDSPSVVFEMNNSRSPLVVKSKDKSNFIGIVMPLRI